MGFTAKSLISHLTLKKIIQKSLGNVSGCPQWLVEPCQQQQHQQTVSVLPPPVPVRWEKSVMMPCPRHVLSRLSLGSAVILSQQMVTKGILLWFLPWSCGCFLLLSCMKLVLVKCETKTSKPWSSRNSFQSPYVEECVWKGVLNNCLWCLCRKYQYQQNITTTHYKGKLRHYSTCFSIHFKGKKYIKKSGLPYSAIG